MLRTFQRAHRTTLSLSSFARITSGNMATSAAINTLRSVGTAAGILDDEQTIEVLDASELQDGQMKEVEFLSGKVLLSKLGGQLHATSAHCSHYGAPLAKGVLSHDGRVVCPWHGACFNVCTGDIEDAPGLSSLHSYKATLSDDKTKILVTASASTVKDKGSYRKITRGVKSVSPNAKNGQGENVVIVGGGPGGLHTIESLRMNGWTGGITLISKEEYPPIDRTRLSKGLVADPSKVQWRSADELKNDFGVDLHTGTTVTKIDPSSRTVSVKDGADVKYDYLVLAPGSVTKTIPIGGVNLENVLTLRTVQDVQKIVAGICPDADIAIIGTSFIGVELAGAINGKKPKSVTLIGVDEAPFVPILGQDIGKAIQRKMEGQGIKFIMGASIEKIAPSDSDPSKAGSVVIKGHDPVSASTVILGVGVKPATGFLKDSGFELEKDGGITVDEYLKVQGHDGRIFAIGDIAHYPQYPEKESRRIEHWNVASNQGRHVAHTITNPDAANVFNKVPIFWSSAGGGLRYCGSGAGYDDIHIDGDISKELKFVAFYAKEGKVTAVASISRDPYVSKASELLRLERMPSMAEIKAGKDILTVDIASP